MVYEEYLNRLPPIEMAFEREGSAVATTASTSTTAPPRRKKHQYRAKPKSKRNHRRSLAKGGHSSPCSGPVSELDVGHHVATQYITGPGGILRDKAARRDRMERSTEILENDQTHKEQMEYLRNLDRHPALVLNADYQVCS